MKSAIVKDTITKIPKANKKPYNNSFIMLSSKNCKS